MIVKALISVFVCLGLGFLSGYVSGSGLSDYYLALNKPSFMPPAWLFGPVWTVLYTMMGVAFAIVWDKNSDKKASSAAMTIFGVQFFFNLIWTPLFFLMRQEEAALVVIIILIFLIIKTISAFKPISLLASRLLIPYLIWVSFATLLNASIVYLN